MKHTNKNRAVWLGLLFFIVTSTLSLLATSAEHKKKFQFELYGGLAMVQPKDLNQISETGRNMQHFMYDAYYDYVLSRHEIIGWSQTKKGTFGDIKNGIPFGFRLKYPLNDWLAVSVGLKRVTASRKSDPSFEYKQDYGPNYAYLDARQYDEYSLSASGFAPLLALHLGTHLTRNIELSGYLGGGPLFGQCQYKFTWTDTWTEVDYTYGYVLYRNSSSINEKGTGTGLALEGGLNVKVQMGPSLGLFIEGVYAYQKINSLAGSGSTQRQNATLTWEGQWGMKQEEIINIFIGSLPVEYPTNSWKNSETPARAFHLDLSGFECRLGLVYRF